MSKKWLPVSMKDVPAGTTFKTCRCCRGDLAVKGIGLIEKGAVADGAVFKARCKECAVKPATHPATRVSECSLPKFKADYALDKVGFLLVTGSTYAVQRANKKASTVGFDCANGRGIKNALYGVKAAGGTITKASYSIPVGEMLEAGEARAICRAVKGHLGIKMTEFRSGEIHIVLDAKALENESWTYWPSDLVRKSIVLILNGDMDKLEKFVQQYVLGKADCQRPRCNQRYAKACGNPEVLPTLG